MRVIKDILHNFGIIKYSGIDLAIYNTQKAVTRLRSKITDLEMSEYEQYERPDLNHLYEKIGRQEKYLSRMKKKRDKKSNK